MLRLLRRFSRPIFRHTFTSYAISAVLLILSFEHAAHLYSYRIPKPTVPLDEPFAAKCLEPDVHGPRANATIFMLARNKEVEGAVSAIHDLERQFNRLFNYPIVFLNDEPWEDYFVDRLTRVSSGKARFEVVSNGSDMWGYPESVDAEAARTQIAAQGAKGIKYGGQESYHHMCRFNAGKFFDHEALKPYKWYWRVEPGVRFTCAITYDPFIAMENAKKVYGYIMALWELGNTVPSLFSHVSHYKESHNIPSSNLWKSFVEPSWAPLPFRRLLSGFPGRDSHGNAWNLCHYWSNFEIADMDWFRSAEYRELFQTLDETGGIYYERWGDAPIHSLAAALFLKPEQTHRFADFGYIHGQFQACPLNALGGQLSDSSGVMRGPFDQEQPTGLGCRCACDYDIGVPQNVCRETLERAVR